MSPPAVPRRGRATRIVGLVLGVAVVVVTIAAFHAVIAQHQVRLEELRARTTRAEEAYEAQRLLNGQLTSPARITNHAAAMGLAPPDVAPVAVPVLGDVPRRGGSSPTMVDWSEVKPHLHASS